MRELVSLSDLQQARHLVAYLAVQSIQATVDEDTDEWVIWIHNDDDRDKAARILDEFRQNPNDVRYENAERKVRHVLKEADRLRKEVDRKQVSLQKRWSGLWWYSYPATYVMIGICLIVALVCTDWRGMQAGPMGPQLCNDDNSEWLLLLRVLKPFEVVEQNGRRIVYYHRIPDFPEGKLDVSTVTGVLKSKLTTTWTALKWTLSGGEVWRPVTPIFLHFSILHILFNMMWLRAIGTAVEYARGTRRFILLCLVLAVASNIAQLYWAGPAFGGMSGVVFGLIGYVWMKGRTQPQHGIGLGQQTIVFAVLWLFLCMVGVFGAIANAAHMVGFVGGILIGARQAIWKKMSFAK